VPLALPHEVLQLRHGEERLRLLDHPATDQRRKNP
jgi:hypothetical protein